ncbi:FixH family protein [Lysinibacillus sp. NPDC097279]|uniref:FixH family protein n=1 Tax=unclassified Lysinibacillus TaxID=2636778 RepID=UPI001168467A|nr:FixH family protein [Lysinibacillus sp. CD3-6]QPQ34367.1 FixH family protein [Lysinibacillus sp. JNUCC-52]UED79673.1 FixH family protein [Lysinibacillus sp. CD3-6]
MKKWLFTLIAVPALLVGCGEKEEPATSSALEEPQMLEVEILTPKEVAINAPIELAAHVIQGEKNIDDAIVEFEVWESGKRDEGQMLEGTLEKDGVYKAQTTFDHDGVYFMFAHTTANGIHNMPKQQITAGTPDMTQVIKEDEKANMNMSDHGKDSSEDSEH